MEVFFMVMFVMGIIIAAICVNFACDSDSYPELAAGVVGIVTGLIICGFGIGSAISSENEYDKDTVELCSSKHGIVSRDGHCFVNNKPVEFTPGIWER
jgi:hypothetical protein